MTTEERELVERLRGVSSHYSTDKTTCDAAASLIERIAKERDDAREALREIADHKYELETPSIYSRGFNDGRWRARRTALAALGELEPTAAPPQAPTP